MGTCVLVLMYLCEIILQTMFELQYTCDELLNQHQRNEHMSESLKLNKVEIISFNHANK